VRRTAVGGARYNGTTGGAAAPLEAGGGSRRTGPRGRAERVGFDGSEGEMKMG
jgi:hypothetical protein